MLQRDGSSIFASADCNNVRAAVHIWPRLIEIARAKSRKDLSRPRLPARTRRRYISYRRTERSVPDGGLTSCRTSFALHVFGTDRLKQSHGPNARNVDARQRSEDEVRYICGYPWKPSARCECH